MDDCISRIECKTCQEKYDEINNSQNRRLDAIESDIRQIRDLTVAVEKMVISLEVMAKELEKQGKRLDAIESEPAQKWKNAVWLVVSGLIGAAIAAVVGKLI